jgi:hypothetical protein
MQAGLSKWRKCWVGEPLQVGAAIGRAWYVVGVRGTNQSRPQAKVPPAPPHLAERAHDRGGRGVDDLGGRTGLRAQVCKQALLGGGVRARGPAGRRGRLLQLCAM